jgi:hypothetical protein
LRLLSWALQKAAVWQRIVKNVLRAAGVLVLLIVVAVATGKVAGAIALTFVLAIVGYLANRVRGFPIGAIGRLTATEVETYPVHVFRLPLAVPVGRFPMNRFQAINVVEHIIMPRTASIGTNTGRVILVGKPGTPNIQFAAAAIDAAWEIGRELGALINLDVKRVDAPGSHTVRVSL